MIIPDGCCYCGMTGYEDYPSNKIPCRMQGHVELAYKPPDLSKARSGSAMKIESEFAITKPIDNLIVKMRYGKKEKP